MNATQQKFKPILFSTEMVQAILAGRKTQTRRVVKPQPTHWVSDSNRDVNPVPCILEKHGLRQSISQPFYEDDILWVRETSVFLHNQWIYKADNLSEMKLFSGWKPSIFMPKEAARIFLKVTNVRVERLQDISEVDAVAEGIESAFIGMFQEARYRCYLSQNKFPYKGFPEHWASNWRDPISSFKSLWQSINAKKHPWESNPWVWVYEFERIEKTRKL